MNSPTPEEWELFLSDMADGFGQWLPDDFDSDERAAYDDAKEAETTTLEAFPMSKMSQLHAALCEANGGVDPCEPDDSDYDSPPSPAERLRCCDVCDQPGTPDNPVAGPSDCCGIETYCHTETCHEEF